MYIYILDIWIPRYSLPYRIHLHHHWSLDLLQHAASPKSLVPPGVQATVRLGDHEGEIEAWGEAPRPRSRYRLTYHLVICLGWWMGFFFTKSLWKKWTCDASWGFIAVFGNCFPRVVVVYSCQIFIVKLKIAVWRCIYIFIYTLFRTKVYTSFPNLNKPFPWIINAGNFWPPKLNSSSTEPVFRLAQY
jgi:hypothetical protein